MTARRPEDAPAPVHSDAAHRAITAELVRCTLGRPGPQRPELQVGIAGVAAAMSRLAAAFAEAAIAAARALQPHFHLIHQLKTDRRYPR